jgi:hypothetical protein
LRGGTGDPHEVLDLPNLPGVTALDMVHTLMDVAMKIFREL